MTCEVPAGSLRLSGTDKGWMLGQLPFEFIRAAPCGDILTAPRSKRSRAQQHTDRSASGWISSSVGMDRPASSILNHSKIQSLDDITIIHRCPSSIVGLSPAMTSGMACHAHTDRIRWTAPTDVTPTLNASALDHAAPHQN